MTRDEILNMPAGYGMRKLLGEKVMGWNQQGKWWVGKSAVICSVSVWSPDENVNHALAVLNTFDLWEIYKGTEAYSVKILQSDKPVVIIAHVNLCLAISRAALLAVMDNKDV